MRAATNAWRNRGDARRSLLALVMLGLAVQLGCGDDDGGAGRPDAGALDAGGRDGAADDAANPPADGAPDDDASLDGGADGDAGDGRPDYLERVESTSDYAALEADGEVKYLATVDGRAPIIDVPCLFQNTERYPFHVQFLRSVFAETRDLDFDTYVALVLRTATRRWWGGELKRYLRATHPQSARPGVYGYTIYQEQAPPENVTLAQIVEVDRRLKANASALASELVFVPTGTEQEAHVRSLVEALRAEGVAVLFPEDLIERDYELYSAGESYGYLHVVPRGELAPNDYGARDVLVVEAAPNDLTTVAGLVTAWPQSVHSHANLRLREKGLPNALLASAYEDSRIETLADQLVHVVADASQLTIEAATIEDAQRFWDAHRPVVGPVQSDLAVTALEGLDGLTHDDALAYGAKAANLGELHAILPPDHRVEGFAIPFSAYRGFVVHNELDAVVDALLADPRVHTDRAHRDDALDDLRDQIRDGEFQPGFLDALFARLREVYGAEVERTFIRFRSSTNAEDLDTFSGAGLYDSNTGCLGDDLDGDDAGPSACLSATHRAWIDAELVRRRAELAAHPERGWVEDIIEDLEEDLVDEKPVADAVRKVWRSLWNLRAFDERDYYGIDHRSVYMGIAVQPTFVLERREAVAVTNLRPDAGDPLYRVVSQVGEIGVVRPIEPAAVPETLTFRRGAGGATDVRLAVPSSLSPGGARLWSDAELATLASLLFTIQDHFAANVYPDLSGLRLDLEIEVTSDDRIVVKQARPYLGVEP